jgi:diguanylate cyclase (GGDEF)-like protein
MSNTPVPELSLLRAFEGALREGRLLDESLGGILDAALAYFDAAAVAILPAGGAPPMTRCGRSIVATAAEQRLSRHLEEILLQGREARVTDSGLAFHGVPVKVAEQVRGAFGLALGAIRGRPSDHDEAVRLFARCASHVLDRDRTISTLMKRREEAVALFELASGALHSMNVDEVIRLTVASLARELEFEQVRAFRFDTEAREVEEILSHGPPSFPAGTAPAPGRRAIDGEEMLVRCLSSHGPAFEDEEGSTAGGGPPRRRRMALPLQAGETVFGFLVMARRGSFVLTPQEMRLAQELARLAAGALEKARLIDAERRTSERVAFVARLHAALSGMTEVDAILQRTVKEVGPHFDADLCAIRLLPTGELPGASAVSLKSGSPGPRAGEDVPDALLSHLSAEGSHVLLADAAADPRGIGLVPAPDLLRGLARPISLLAVPLAYRGAIVGVLAAVTGGRQQGFGVATLRAFEAVATEVSLAVTSARLIQKERDSYRFLDRLREVGRSLSTTFDAARIKQTLCEQAVQLLKADAAHFWDADPQSKGLQVTSRWGADVGGEIGRTVPTEQSGHPVVRAFLEKGLLFADEAEAATLFDLPVPSGPPVAKAAIVPLVYQDERIGALTLVLRRGATAWPPDLAGRLALLADSGAIALHNARMMRIIEQQTERDSMTGLYNRSSILRRLEAEVRRAERNGQAIAVAALRMDGLFEATQRLGASFGDVVLPKAAAQLVRATRSVNVVGRDAGDRFWILVFDANKAQAHRAMDAIQKNFVASAVDPRLDPAGIRFNLTAGLAAYPEDAFDAQSLGQRAEEALDDAIKSGPGSIMLYGALASEDPASY